MGAFLNLPDPVLLLQGELRISIPQGHHRGKQLNFVAFILSTSVSSGFLSRRDISII